MEKEHYWLSPESIGKLSEQSVHIIKEALQDATDKQETILLNVSPNAASENVSTFVILLGLAQYDAEWIKALATWKIDLEFADAEGVVVPQNEWAKEAEILRWFDIMREHCPCSLPFLAQWEACFLGAASDIVAALEHDEIEWHPENDTAVFHLSPLENQTIFGRVMQHCEQFLEYCHETDVDAEPYLTELVRKFNFETPYEQIKASWQTHRGAQ